MWIKEPDSVTDTIEFVGRPELCTYLLKGAIYALVGGVMAHIAPQVISQLNDLNIDIERIGYLIILHTHYDHLGMAPYLSKHWPWLKIAVSSKGVSILKNEKALDAIQELNNSFIEKNNIFHTAEPLNIVKEGFPVHHIFSEREEIDLGNGIRAHVIDSPGHSVCSQSLFVPGEHALFPSDSMGALTEEMIMPVGSSNYDNFQDSIDLLSKTSAEIICFEHFGALTPDDGREFFDKSKRAAEEFREKMIYMYNKIKYIDRTVEKIAKELECGLTKAGLLPEDLLKDTVKRMVTFVNKVG